MVCLETLEDNSCSLLRQSLFLQAFARDVTEIMELL